MVTHILLPYGAPEPLVLYIASGSLVADLAGPEGVAGPAAANLVAEALTKPADVPPLGAHAVSGDRVVLAVSGEPPQASAAIDAVTRSLVTAGIGSDSISVLHAGSAPAEPGFIAFRCDEAAATSYLAADDEGQPLHLARMIVDADLVVTIGEWSFDASLGGRSLQGELWPAFGRPDCQTALARDLVRRGRGALSGWLENLRALTWQLGVMTCLRLVAGQAGSLAAAAFGTSNAAALAARRAAAGWAPVVASPASLAICSLTPPSTGFDTVVRAVAAAARITRPDGTICISAAGLSPPGPVLTRWRQGAPLVPLLREARKTDDPALIADAVVTRLLASSLGDRRLILLSPLDEQLVEDLEFGHAGSPEAIARLAGRADRVAVLREADRMLPRLG